jgi:hypothetical protein
MPYVNAEAAGRDEIRAWGKRAQALVDCFVQTTPGTTRLDGDTASGRAYIQELIRLRDGRSELNTPSTATSTPPDGWKLTERVYEVRHIDTTPLAGSVPRAAGCPLTRRSGTRLRLIRKTVTMTR